MAKKETDREKFIRLANSRVNNALKAIQLIGNLSNRSNYEFSEKDVEKIFAALLAQVRACRERFQASGPRNRTGFTLE